MPDDSIIPFDIGVLLGLARLYAVYRDAAFFSPFHQQATDIFRAVIDVNGG